MAQLKIKKLLSKIIIRAGLLNMIQTNCIQNLYTNKSNEISNASPATPTH